MTPEEIKERRDWLDTLTGYTPGPWRVVIDENAAQATGFPNIESSDYTVVGNEGMYGNIATDFSNAHLIAATPVLRDRYAAALDEVERLREALLTIRDKRRACFRAADCRAVARAALSPEEKGND